MSSESSFDITLLALPISPQSPAGCDLSERVFAPSDHTTGDRERSGEEVLDQIRRFVRATPPEGVLALTRPASPPWESMRDLCLELLGKLRHLDAAVHLTVIELEMRGLPGLRDGLALVALTVQNLWSSVQPGPASVSKNYRARRKFINEVSQPYSKPGDLMLFRNRVANMPLLAVDPSVTVSSILASEGVFPIRVDEGSGSEEQREAIRSAARSELKSRLELARKTAPAEDIRASIDHVKNCLASLQSIADVFRNAPDVPENDREAPDVAELKQTLEVAARFLNARLKEDAGEQNANESTVPASAVPSRSDSLPQSAAVMDWRSLRITSDTEARLAFDAIRRYVEIRDRASPVALVVDYGKLLVGLSYEDVSRLMPFSVYETMKEHIRKQSETRV